MINISHVAKLITWRCWTLGQVQHRVQWIRLDYAKWKAALPSLSPKDKKSANERDLNSLWNKVLPQSWNLTQIPCSSGLRDLSWVMIYWPVMYKVPKPPNSYFDATQLLFKNHEIRSLNQIRTAWSLSFNSSMVCKADVLYSCGTKLGFLSPCVTPEHVFPYCRWIFSYFTILLVVNAAIGVQVIFTGHWMFVSQIINSEVWVFLQNISVDHIFYGLA